MSNNIFSGKRFGLLWKQHVIHNAQFLLLAMVAYIGVIFIVLSIAQIGNDLQPHNLESFQICLVSFVSIFAILYVGHSFPAFRSTQSTMYYLMVPASVLEKFVFELVSRIGITIPLLFILYWVTFHVQGYFFNIFTDAEFQPIGLQYLVKIDPTSENRPLLYSILIAGSLLGLVLAFTGAAMFMKQPLVKSLFAVAVIVMSFVGYSYVLMTQLDIEEYHPPDSMLFVPLEEANALRFVSIGLMVALVVMLFVAYRKLKEREV